MKRFYFNLCLSFDAETEEEARDKLAEHLGEINLTEDHFETDHQNIKG